MFSGGERVKQMRLVADSSPLFFVLTDSLQLLDLKKTAQEVETGCL
jgi:hypothetical protein